MTATSPLSELDVHISVKHFRKVATVCAVATFHDVICAATGDAAFPTLSRDSHHRLVNGQFQIFCDLYNSDIRSMTRFTLSDTTPSAKRVAVWIPSKKTARCSY
ncbi:hypothetical protein PHMEG_00022779 [Phytophthora megakarya]|uniref:Uncharacterized protein n=1 Tax=Phytophthora megakarya TaxID=4795 RepID=A0A225VJJ3_9STRA|nr:hypothetical protein PHMEG_00022779 [Phytophthora megakarya]